jgi:hypothetical protein
MSEPNDPEVRWQANEIELRRLTNVPPASIEK